MSNTTDQIADLFRIGTLKLPPSITAGAVSFLYTLLARFIDIIIIWLCYCLLAHQVAASPPIKATLYQRIALNDFGVKLQINPTMPWYKAWYPYCFMPGVLFRGTGLVVCFALLGCKLAVAWAEVLTDTTVEVVSKVDTGVYKQLEGDDYRSMLFQRKVHKDPKPEWNMTGGDAVELSWWNTENMVDHGMPTLSNYTTYYRSMGQGTSTGKNVGGRYNDYPNGICFYPELGNSSIGSAICEGVKLECRPATRERDFGIQMSGSTGTNTLVLMHPDNSTAVTSTVHVPGIWYTYTKEYGQPLTERMEGVSGVEGWFKYIYLNPIVMSVPIDTKDICKDVPAEERILPPKGFNFLSLDLDWKPTPSGWQNACIDDKQSMLVFLGQCNLRFWRGRRKIDTATRVFTDGGPSEDQFVRFILKPGAGEIFDAAFYHPGGTGDILQPFLAFNMTRFKPEDFTNETAEKLYGQFVLSQALALATFEYGAEGTWDLPALPGTDTELTYEVWIDKTVVRQAVYLYPLSVVLGVILCLSGWVLLGSTVFRRSYLLGFGRGRRKQSAYTALPRIDEPEVAVASEYNLGISDPDLCYSAETNFVHDQITSLGSVRYLLREATRRCRCAGKFELEPRRSIHPVDGVPSSTAGPQNPFDPQQ